MASINNSLSNNNVAKTNSNLAASIARLNSGQRITRAADDVAALAVGTALNTAVIELRSALTNTTQGSSLLQVADGGLTQQMDILQRQKSLAMRASSGQMTDAERSALNQEFQGLSDQLNQISGSTNFNGVKLLDGTANLNFPVGNGSGSDAINVALNSTSSATLFNNQTVDISSQASAAAASTSIDNAITAVASSRASVGAFQSRFDAASNAISSAIASQDAARSNLLDTDIAAESTSFAALIAQQQASIATQAQTNKLSGSLLKLIG